MLTPVAAPEVAHTTDDDAGVGALVSRLVADGRALAQAEVEPYKVKAGERVGAYKRAAIFFGIAAVLTLAALIALLVGLELTLAPLVGPGGATAIVVIATMLIAGILGLVGKRALAPPQAHPDEELARQVVRAEQDKVVARYRAVRTWTALQHKLSPTRIAHRAARDAADKGNAAVEAARRNPGAAAGITAIAGLFLARHRIAALFRRDRSRAADTDAD